MVLYVNIGWRRDMQFKFFFFFFWRSVFFPIWFDLMRSYFTRHLCSLLGVWFLHYFWVLVLFEHQAWHIILFYVCSFSSGCRGHCGATVTFNGFDWAGSEVAAASRLTFDISLFVSWGRCTLTCRYNIFASLSSLGFGCPRIAAPRYAVRSLPRYCCNEARWRWHVPNNSRAYY